MYNPWQKYLQRNFKPTWRRYNSFKMNQSDIFISVHMIYLPITDISDVLSPLKKDETLAVKT